MTLSKQNPQKPYELIDYFWHEISISKKQNSRVEKGLLHNQFVALKIFTCNFQEQLLYPQILLKRQSPNQTLTPWKPINSSILTESKIHTVNGQAKAFLYIYSPYKIANQIHKYTNTSLSLSPYRISDRQKAFRIHSIIKKLIVSLMINSNYQLYSIESFLFDEKKEELAINPTSFVGMKLLLNNEQISKNDFLQIYELLPSNLLQNQPNQRFTIQLKFRAIGSLLLTLILQRRFHLFIQKQTLSKLDICSVQQIKELLKQSKLKFDKMLKIPSIKQIIKKLDDNLNVNFMKFLTQVFAQENTLTWTNIVELLISKQPRLNPSSDKPSIKTLQIATYLFKQSIKHPSIRDNLKQLGLKQSNEMKLYMIALLYDPSTHAEQLLKYEDLDDFFLNPKSFNPQNMAIYKKLVSIIKQILQKTHFKTEQNYKKSVKDFRSMDQFSDICQKSQINQSQTVFEGKQQMQFQQLHLREYLQKISNNFGIFRSTIGQRMMVAPTEHHQTIKIYSKLFK